LKEEVENERMLYGISKKLQKMLSMNIKKKNFTDKNYYKEEMKILKKKNIF
jgi:hypothetical protein